MIRFGYGISRSCGPPACEHAEPQKKYVHNDDTCRKRGGSKIGVLRAVVDEKSIKALECSRWHFETAAQGPFQINILREKRRQP